MTDDPPLVITGYGQSSVSATRGDRVGLDGAAVTHRIMVAAGTLWSELAEGPQSLHLPGSGAPHERGRNGWQCSTRQFPPKQYSTSSRNSHRYIAILKGLC